MSIVPPLFLKNYVSPSSNILGSHAVKSKIFSTTLEAKFLPVSIVAQKALAARPEPGIPDNETVLPTICPPIKRPGALCENSTDLCEPPQTSCPNPLDNAALGRNLLVLVLVPMFLFSIFQNLLSMASFL